MFFVRLFSVWQIEHCDCHGM